MNTAPKYFEHEFLQLTKEPFSPTSSYLFTTYKFDGDVRYCFKDKESYLQWIKDWKECYKWLTQEIRESKKKRKITLYRGKSNQSFEISYSWAMRKYQGSRLATRMLQLRQEAKELSWAMKEASEGAEV